MKFSVVIPTFNRAQLLARSLAAATYQTFLDYEVLVVDDGSGDETPEVVRAQPKIRYLRQENKGPAAARNLGIAHARGEIIAFTDDDCLVPRDWLARIDAGFAKYPEVVGVGGYQEAPEELLRSNILTQYERYVSRVVYGVGNCEVIGGFECPAGGTNNIAYRRSIFAAVGGFDESFPFAAGEDADLKWRLCQLGYKLLYVPVKATHLQPYRLRSFIKQNRVRGRGAVRFEEKWASRPTRLRVAGRFARRFLTLWWDLAAMPSRRMAVVKFIGGFYDCIGQWERLSYRG